MHGFAVKPTGMFKIKGSIHHTSQTQINELETMPVTEQTIMFMVIKESTNTESNIDNSPRDLSGSKVLQHVLDAIG
jgi:hypothetical protein